MALMSFREGDKVRSVGVRPYHWGEQVLEYGEANNNTVIIYTVPADKVLYLLMFGIWNFGSVNGNAYLRVYDATPAIWRVFGRAYNRASVSEALRYVSCNPPVEIPSSYSLRVTSDAAGVVAGSVIHGWVE